jgi:phosphonoacetaldehyde hydrolase
MIRGVIFDLGGTLIDKYSLSPLVNLSKAFRQRNVVIPNKLIGKDMGLKKIEHIYSIAQTDTFKSQFRKHYGRYHNDSDLHDIYTIFCANQRESLNNEVTILPETVSAIQTLRDRNIKVGITTGFNREQMDLCIRILNRHSIYPDAAVSSTCIPGARRPEPLMIYGNMKQMGIDNPKEIIKVDDTVIGLKEGINAECLTCGVARWSVNMRVYDQDDAYLLETDSKEFHKRLHQTRSVLLHSGSTYIINNLTTLKDCLPSMEI